MPQNRRSRAPLTAARAHGNRVLVRWWCRIEPCVSDQLDRAGCSVESIDGGAEGAAEDAAGRDEGLPATWLDDIRPTLATMRLAELQSAHPDVFEEMKILSKGINGVGSCARLRREGNARTFLDKC